MIVSTRFPASLGRDLGGPERLLEIGRNDLVTASKGELKSQRAIRLGVMPGVELEILPPKGAIMKARIYATKNQIFQVVAHIPRARLESEDVHKFLDSFQLLSD